MLLQELSAPKSTDIISCQCDNCSDPFTKQYFYFKSSRIKYDGKDLCKKCCYLFRPDTNNMRGKKHKKESLEKMSKSRTGKIGEQATAWKGGHQTLNKQLKKLLVTRWNWSKRVFIRDNYTCKSCDTRGGRLDAHHIVSFSSILKNLLLECSDIEWLINHPLIADHELSNGITLCRKCHKEKHKDWGSHNIE